MLAALCAAIGLLAPAACRDRMEVFDGGREPAGPIEARLDEAGYRVRSAVARLAPTSGNEVRGTVRLGQRPDGLAVDVTASGLPRGRHVLVVHELGDCTARDASSAGEPLGVERRTRPANRRIPAVAAELASWTGGQASGSGFLGGVTIGAGRAVLGRSVVLHRASPDGGPGDRLACGVIGIAAPGS